MNKDDSLTNSVALLNLEGAVGNAVTKGAGIRLTPLHAMYT